MPDISAERFQEIAEAVKQSCLVSVALANIPTSLTAHFLPWPGIRGSVNNAAGE